MKSLFSSLKERCYRSLLYPVSVIASEAKQSTVSISPVSSASAPAPVSSVSSSMKLSSCKNSSSSRIRNGSFVIRNGIGFTLVELMIVIAIIGVLAASLFPMMSGYMERAKFATLQKQFKEIQNATQIHFNDLGSYPANCGVNCTSSTLDSYLPDAHKMKHPFGGHIEFGTYPCLSNNPNKSHFYIMLDDDAWGTDSSNNQGKISDTLLTRLDTFLGDDGNLNTGKFIGHGLTCPVGGGFGLYEGGYYPDGE